MEISTIKFNLDDPNRSSPIMEHQINFIMKRIILPALIVGGLTLFSFTSPTNGGVNNTGKNLQKSVTGLHFEKFDNQQVKSLTEENYNLEGTQLIGSHLKDGIQSELRGKWIFISKFSLSIFSTTVINDSGETETIAAENVTEILKKYSGAPNLTKGGGTVFSLSTKTRFSDEDRRTLIDFVKKEYKLSDEQLEKGVVLEMKEN